MCLNNIKSIMEFVIKLINSNQFNQGEGLFFYNSNHYLRSNQVDEIDGNEGVVQYIYKFHLKINEPIDYLLNELSMKFNK